MPKNGIHIFMLLVLSYGCTTPSVLIHPDDKVFAEAQLKLETTFRELEKNPAPILEKMQFLQAESHYRYRFEPPIRSTTSYFAEAAAAITDFPAFQALAGSLDVGDLRLRSADSAVQLWETLLIMHTKTQLRPLTLYRLGWAYRNIGIAGLPRASANDAFDSLMKEFPESPLAPLAEAAKSVDWKSKDVASARSVIPGLGQLYVGETKNGVIRIGVAATAAAAILVPAYIASHRKNALVWSKDWGLLLSGLSGQLF